MESTLCRMLRFAILLLVTMSFTQDVNAEYTPKVGELHPDFTLPNINSVGLEQPKAVSLSDFRGSKVLLIHFASW